MIIPPCCDEPRYRAFPGTLLVACNSEFPGIVNGSFLEILSATSRDVFVRDVEAGLEVQMTPEQVSRHTKLRHAITLASCQGRTLQGVVRLCDISSPHMTPAGLYVAASRATHPDLFQVAK